MVTLAQAIIDQNEPLIKRFLQGGAPVNEFDEYGFTPLIEAAIVNNTAISRLLIDEGADVNKKDMVGSTPLHWAVENSNLELCKLLLAQKADANAYNNNGEPLLVKPILRGDRELKQLLYQYDASPAFAMDFIHAKLLGHRYDLRSSVDIVSPSGSYVEVGLEGFFLEFSVNLVSNSLMQYLENYSAKAAKPYFPIIKRVADAMSVAGELIHYQQYQKKINQHLDRINYLLNSELLIMPVNYEGHAITYIRYGDILVKCDRRKKELMMNGIVFYKMKNPTALTKSLIRTMIYEKKDEQFISETLAKQLQLELKARMMIAPQMTGNCSWANVVACFPAAFYLLSENVGNMDGGLIDYQHISLVAYHHWREWDKTRALHYFLNAFDDSNRARKASIAAILGVVFFQRFHHQNSGCYPIAQRILKILRLPEYQYILKSYIEHYCHRKKTFAGENLKKLIEVCDSFI